MAEGTVRAETVRRPGILFGQNCLSGRNIVLSCQSLALKQMLSKIHLLGKNRSVDKNAGGGGLFIINDLPLNLFIYAYFYQVLLYCNKGAKSFFRK